MTNYLENTLKLEDLSSINRDSHAPAGMKKWPWLRMGCTNWLKYCTQSEAGFSFTRIQAQESQDMQLSVIPRDSHAPMERKVNRGLRMEDQLRGLIGAIDFKQYSMFSRRPGREKEGSGRLRMDSGFSVLARDTGCHDALLRYVFRQSR
jgi:hypothetical protein